MSVVTKRRHFTVSGAGLALVESGARMSKPSGKTLRAHHDASLTTDAGRLTPRIRALFAAQPRRPRRKPQRPAKRSPLTGGTRAGKRVPKRAKRAAARAGHPGRARD
jgi:hypothetical protein